jgi:hypothetical protein
VSVLREEGQWAGSWVGVTVCCEDRDSGQEVGLVCCEKRDSGQEVGLV